MKRINTLVLTALIGFGLVGSTAFGMKGETPTEKANRLSKQSTTPVVLTTPKSTQKNPPVNQKHETPDQKADRLSRQPGTLVVQQGRISNFCNKIWSAGSNVCSHVWRNKGKYLAGAATLAGLVIANHYDLLPAMPAMLSRPTWEGTKSFFGKFSPWGTKATEAPVANVDTTVANVDTVVANIDTVVANIDTVVANIDTTEVTVTVATPEVPATGMQAVADKTNGFIKRFFGKRLNITQQQS